MNCDFVFFRFRDCPSLSGTFWPTHADYGRCLQSFFYTCSFTTWPTISFFTDTSFVKILLTLNRTWIIQVTFQTDLSTAVSFSLNSWQPCCTALPWWRPVNLSRHSYRNLMSTTSYVLIRGQFLCLRHNGILCKDFHDTSRMVSLPANYPSLLARFTQL